MYKPLALCLGLGLSTNLAAQQTPPPLKLQCRWTTQCVDLDPCQEVSSTLGLEITAGQPPFDVTATFDSETMRGNALTLGDGILIQLSSVFGPLILSIDGSGAARQSAHSRDSAMMVSHAGNCEALN